MSSRNTQLDQYDMFYASLRFEREGFFALIHNNHPLNLPPSRGVL
jgi:hypothetical protein